MSHSPTQHVVVQTEHLDGEAAAWLGQRCRLVACSYDDPAFEPTLAQADALLVRTYTIVDRAMLDRAPRLKVIGRAGAGVDNIDVTACRARGIEVVYTPDANTQAVVEFVLALMGDALRPRITLNRAIDSAEWNRLRAEAVGRRQINELTLGIVGMGRVGKGVARVASAIGCPVLYNDLIEIEPWQRSGAEPVTAETLFERSDALSVHIDGRPENRGFVDARLIRRMKENVLFINTSRGFVVDNLALAEFMRSHPQALTCLDVHEPEPFGPDYPLLGLPNVRLYPHLASRTETAMRNMSWVVKDVWAVLAGSQPQFPAPR